MFAIYKLPTLNSALNLPGGSGKLTCEQLLLRVSKFVRTHASKRKESMTSSD